MRISLLRLCAALAIVSVVLGEQADPEKARKSVLQRIFSPVTSIYDKTKSGFARIGRSSASKERKVIEAAEESEENSLGEGVGAVLEVLDELAADGEESTSHAADKMKRSMHHAKDSVEDTASHLKEVVMEAVDESLENAVVEEDVIEHGIKELIGHAEESEAAQNVEEVAEEVDEVASVAEEAAEGEAKRVGDAAEAASEAASKEL